MTPINLPSFVEGGKQFTFGYRDDIIVKQQSPGPIYNVDDNINENRLKKLKNSCQGFGKGDRNKMSKDEMSFPGPGNYSPPHRVGGSGGQWSFSKSVRKS